MYIFWGEKVKNSHQLDLPKSHRDDFPKTVSCKEVKLNRRHSDLPQTDENHESGWRRRRWQLKSQSFWKEKSSDFFFFSPGLLLASTWIVVKKKNKIKNRKISLIRKMKRWTQSLSSLPSGLFKLFCLYFKLQRLHQDVAENTMIEKNWTLHFSCSYSLWREGEG